MWDKNLRLVVIFLIYQSLFYNQDESFFEDSYWSSEFSIFLNTLELEGEVKEAEVRQELKNYFNLKPELEKLILNRSTDWNKTYSLTKAALLSFCLEKKIVSQDLLPKKEPIVDLEENVTIQTAVKPSEEPKNPLIKIYLKFTHDYIGEKNVALVHAVLSKLV